MVALLAALRSTVRSRTALTLEVFALRHQLAVLRRQAPSRPRRHRLDRLVWVDLSRVWASWSFKVRASSLAHETKCHWSQTREGLAGPSVSYRAACAGAPPVDDAEAFGRPNAWLLLALPLLVVAERVVNLRLGPMVRTFVERGLIPDAARARFDASIDSAMRLRRSITAEVLLNALVYVAGVGFIWRTQTALDVATWPGAPGRG